jgi:hypothetical protein
MHKTRVFMDNVSFKYFKTKSKASMKQLRWHDNSTLLDVELIKKPRWDNIVLDWKEEF